MQGTCILRRLATPVGMQSEAPRAIVEGLAQCRRTNSVSLRIYSMLQSRPGHDIFRLSLFSEPVNKREQS